MDWPRRFDRVSPSLLAGGRARADDLDHAVDAPLLQAETCHYRGVVRWRRGLRFWVTVIDGRGLAAAISTAAMLSGLTDPR